MTAEHSVDVGAIVKVHGVTSKPELNGRQGFVDKFTPTGRVGVQLFVTDIDVRGKPNVRPSVSFKPENLHVQESAIAWLVSPEGNLSPFNFAEGIDLTCNMSFKRRKDDLERQLVWKSVMGHFQASYTQYSPYTDLGYFWDSDSNDSLINPVNNLSSYPKALRGSVVVYRLKPPTVDDLLLGVRPDVQMPPRSSKFKYTLQIGKEELADTLAFYKSRSFLGVNALRAEKRMGIDVMMADIPHRNVVIKTGYPLNRNNI